MCYSFDEPWTWDELFAAKKQANEMMDSVTHKVGVIMDASRNTRLPAHLLTNVRNGLRAKHPNTLVIAVVITRPVVHTMINTLRGIARAGSVRLEPTATLEEARALVYARLREYEPNGATLSAQ
jgi:hypothetical protein